VSWLTPGNGTNSGHIATLGRNQDLWLGEDRAVLIALGGIAHRLPVEQWPRLPGIRWLVAADWQCQHPDAIAFESFGLNFTDLLCSVDAVVTKPGYGTFTEAACNGTPVLYQQRMDWPEQDCLIEWLDRHGTCQEVPAESLQTGELAESLDALRQAVLVRKPLPGGAAGAAAKIYAALTVGQQTLATS